MDGVGDFAPPSLLKVLTMSMIAEARDQTNSAEGTKSYPSISKNGHGT